MSDKKISDNVISNAAELLYKGAKMLTYHCPDCKLPLFEKDGKIFCPSCGREAVFEKDLEKVEEKADEKVEVEKKIEEKPKIEGDLLERVEMAAKKVCDMIISAENESEVKVLTDSLKTLVEIMDKLKSL